METGREYNKSVTAIGNGLSNSATTGNSGATPLQSSVNTTSKNPHVGGETASQTTLTGVGAGVPAVGGSQKAEKWGYTTASGSKIELDDTPGGETISLVHHSGAHVTIDPDGFIVLVSSSRKGIGISAPYGDAYMSASGEVVIKGASISAETTGDFNMKVGGNYNLVCDAYKLTTKTMDETIDGTAVRQITNDQSVMIGGVSRTTIAGDERTQVTGNRIEDVGANSTSRVGGNRDVNTTGNLSNLTKGNRTDSTKGKISVITDGDQVISTKGKATFSSTGDTTVSSKGKATYASTGDAIMSSEAGIKVAGDTAKISASSGDASIEASGTASVIGSTGIIGGSTVQVKAGTFLAPSIVVTAASATATPDSAAATVSPADTVDVAQAQTVKATDIVDEMTSARKFPEYPRNAKLESADAVAVQTVSYDKVSGADEVYNEYASKNQGSLNPTTEESYGDVPEISSSEKPNNSQGVDPGIGVPSPHNYASKISRFFTLGDLVNASASHKIPPDKWNSVVANHIYLAYNVLDKIKEKFPNIIVTSAYRNNSPNHITGLAADIVVDSRSLAQHAEIAAFVRDNLPVDQVFLERNTRATHVHVRATKTSGGSPKTLTCADPACGTSTSGLQVSYLTQRGIR